MVFILKKLPCLERLTFTNNIKSGNLPIWNKLVYVGLALVGLKVETYFIVKVFNSDFKH